MSKTVPSKFILAMLLGPFLHRHQKSTWKCDHKDRSFEYCNQSIPFIYNGYV